MSTFYGVSERQAGGKPVRIYGVINYQVKTFQTTEQFHVALKQGHWSVSDPPAL